MYINYVYNINVHPQHTRYTIYDVVLVNILNHVYKLLAIHAPLGRSWLVLDTSLGPTAQGWGAEQERSGSELDFP